MDKANYDVRKPKVTDWNAIWADYKADQEANRHGRNGGDPTVFRPEGLPEQYGLKNTD